MSNIIIRQDRNAIQQSAVNDHTMSRNARGMLMDLLFMNSEASVRSLTDMSSDGQAKVTSALKELEDKGYLIRERTRINGKLSKYNYVLTMPDSPDTVGDLFIKSLEQPVCDMIESHIVVPDVNNPYEEIPCVANHDMVKTTVNQGFSECQYTYSGYDDLIDKNINNNIYISNQSYQSSNLGSCVDSCETNRSCDVSSVKSQVKYDSLIDEMEEQDKDLIDLMVNIISEIYQSKSAWTRVSGRGVPTREVVTQFMKLSKEDLLYVVECMNRTNTKIRSIKPYLITSLYNAAMTQKSRLNATKFNKCKRQSNDSRKYGHKRDELYDNFTDSSFSTEEWYRQAGAYDPEKINFS